eukprot:12740034-Heterocapsa_arctica.AAC.1
MSSQKRSSDKRASQSILTCYTEAIRAVNSALGNKDQTGTTSTAILLDTYVTLLQSDEDNLSMLV